MFPYNTTVDNYVKEFNLNREILDKILHGPNFCDPGFANLRQRFLLDAIAIQQTKKCEPHRAVTYTCILWHQDGVATPDMDDSYIPYAIEKYAQEVAKQTNK